MYVVKFIPQSTPTFWKNVLEGWFHFSKMYDVYDQEGNQIIWCNSEIKINNVPICYDKAINRGLIYVKQMFPNNATISNVEAYEKYRLNWFETTAILNAIPRKWKDMCLRTEDTGPPVSKFELVQQKTHKVSFIYNNMLSKQDRPFEKLVVKINKIITVSRDELEKAFKQIYIVSNITKYRDFQYRLLNLVTHANDRLFYWKKVTSQQCDLCPHPKQNIFHMLFWCPKLQSFWRKVACFCANCLNDPPDTVFDVKSVFLNCVVESNVGHLINFIVLVAKQYIYACKCKKEEIRFEQFIRNIQELYNVEKYNAQINGNIMFHNKKWNCFTGL